MIKKQLTLIVMLIISFTIIISAQQNNPILNTIIKRSIEISPKLKMLKAKREVAYNKISQKSNLPDPMLSLAFTNLPTNTFVFDQEPMTGKVVGLTQLFPFPGKLSAIEDEAAIDTLIIDQEINDEVNKITETVTKNYYDLNYFRRAIFYAKESKKLLKEIEDVVSVKYTVSTATQQNLIKVQLELTKISDKIEELNSREKSTLSVLNSYLLQDAETEIKTELIEKVKPITVTSQKLNELAQANRPFLKGIKLFVEKAKLKQLVARKDYLPNFSLGVQYSFRDRIASSGVNLNNLMTFALGISLPLNYGGKVTAKVEEAVSLQRLYEEQYSSALQFLDSRFGSDIAELKSIEERINLFEDGLMPQAQQNLKSALASYQVNEVDFINVIDAQDQLFQIETNLYRLKTSYLKQIADLEFLTGTRLTN